MELVLRDLTQLRQRRIVMGFDEGRYLFALFLIELRRLTARVWEGLGGASLVLTAQEVPNRGGTDAKQFGHFALRVLPTFIGFYDSVAEIVRVGSHSYKSP